MFNMIPFGRGRRHGLTNWDDFFNDDFFSPMTSMSHIFRADIKETDTTYEVEVDVPGMDKKDIQIHYINNQLIVQGKRSADTEVKEENYIRRERNFGEFRRSFYVDNVDEEKINATFKDGVLKISLPKIETELPKGRQIDID
ncbi:MAG: Hsp20/alpha crystallin family protein [Epulopiscium sp.]|nr:Hsp20/alpha crystallin family protein [Candidatus Epulonipiscium sp.]